MTRQIGSVLMSALLSSAATLCLVTMVGAGAVDDRVVTRGLVITDAAGATRIEMGASSSRSFIDLYGSQGALRVSVEVTRNVPEDLARIRLVDSSGQARVIMGSFANPTTDADVFVARPEHSVVLFGPDGNAIWRQPRGPWLRQ